MRFLVFCRKEVSGEINLFYKHTVLKMGREEKGGLLIVEHNSRGHNGRIQETERKKIRDLVWILGFEETRAMKWGSERKEIVRMGAVCAPRWEGSSPLSGSSRIVGDLCSSQWTASFCANSPAGVLGIIKSWAVDHLEIEAVISMSWRGSLRECFQKRAIRLFENGGNNPIYLPLDLSH